MGHVSRGRSGIVQMEPTPFMKQKPRACVVFFGLVKNMPQENANAISSCVIEPLRKAGFEVDAFLHTYNQSIMHNPRNHEYNVPMNQVAAIETLRQTLPCNFLGIQMSEPSEADSDPTFHPIEHYLRISDPWPDNPVMSLQYFFRQLYSLERATSMAEHAMQAGANYELMVHCRPDLKFLDPIDPGSIQGLLSRDASDRVICLPFWHAFGGYNDRFAFGRPKDMLVYGYRKRHIRDYAAHRVPHSETFLKQHLDAHDIKVAPISMRFLRFRADLSAEPIHGLNMSPLPGKWPWPAGAKW